MNRWLLLGICVLLLLSCDVGYKNDGKTVTYHWWNEGNGHGFRVVDADPETFKNLGDGYARDARHAFHEGYIIEGADGATFKYLGKGYAVDAKHVFCYDTIMPTADPKTFKVRGYYLTEDINDYYWNGNAIHVADKKTFVVIGDIDSWETTWAKDKENAYFMGSDPVPLADFDSFHPIKGEFGAHSGSYAADKYKVYFENHIVKGADPATFREVNFWVGQDKYRIYCKWIPTNVRDYTKLKRIGAMFTDGEHIYNEDLKELEGADLSTFNHLGSNWYADKQYVWWQTNLVREADVNTFEPVFNYVFRYGEKEEFATDFNYGKDAYHVFFQDSIIVGADPATFEKIDFGNNKSWTVFDKKHIYEGEDSEELQRYLKSK